MPPDPLDAVYRYHDGTKHHFQAFARSLGYLDWASQPNPFRLFREAAQFPLYPSPSARTARTSPRRVTFDELFAPVGAVERVSAATIGDLLRHAMGLSAWKQHGRSRWPLRVNPSSGNLHPTEAYVICGVLPALSGTPAVYHYAPDRHLLEERCAFDDGAWTRVCSGRSDLLLVGLTSIHWREAWKYGERAFRYCQHDLGHAIAAIGIAGRLFGWRTELLTEVSQASVAALTGADRDEDFVEAEREEPGCLLAIGPPDDPPLRWQDGGGDLVESVRRGRWTGQANQLSEEHVQWTFIDEAARATESKGIRSSPSRSGGSTRLTPRAARQSPDARTILLQRRSALAFDGRSSIDQSVFMEILQRVLPDAGPGLPWTPRIHFALLVHRVDGVESGLYLLVRDPAAAGPLREACGRDFLWEAVDGVPLLFCLARGDCRSLARRLSCDQDIASDGCFSLGMIADFDRSLAEFGPAFYRHLFWESGFVGQLLYLGAEAAGVRSTGIGCFYDDPVHDLLGLTGHAFQSLYHFTVGMPVEDTRLTTEPGYPWEKSP